MAHCPGQDRYYWTPDDIFDVACPVCDAPVEFMKTDPRRKCDHCGYVFRNPRLELGCAQWCAYAEQCLGFVPDKDPAGADKGPLFDRLLAELKAEFQDDYRRISHALAVYDRAQELLRSEGGDPRVVSAAALLHDIGIKNAERKHGSSAPRYQEIEGPPVARRILEKLGLPEETTDHVCRIVGSHHSGGDIDTPEFRVIWDADHLVNLAEGGPSGQDGGSRPDIAGVLKTETGRAKASEMLARIASV